MTLAQQRFSFYNHQLIELLQATSRKRDKGMSFYKAKARDIIFRIEALCRLYRDVNDKKLFDYWYKEFKALEDTLGAMDHYEAMLNEFVTYKPLKKSAEKILGAQLASETGFLNDVLHSSGWLNGEKMKTFTDALNEHGWSSDAEDSFDYAEGILNELQKLEEKYRSGEIDLTLLEEGLHEFRRRLRWASIYTASSNGLVQLLPTKMYGDEFKKYCAKEVVSSPFNQFPKAPKNSKSILIQSHHLYSLSWLIAYLGELKDIGIRYENFHALCDGAGVRDKKVTEQFLASCKFHPRDISALAELAADNFIHSDNAMERLQRDLLRYIAKEE